MSRSTILMRRALAVGTVILLLLQAFPVLAQGGTITGTGTISGGPLPFGPGLTLTFPPLGGPVSGVIAGQQPFMNGSETCTQSFSGSADGTFAGGDGGVAAGSLVITYQVVCSGGTNTQNYSGTWQGTLTAAGTGSGTWSSAYGGGAWQVSYPAAGFKAIVAPQQLDYLYFERTYGLNVEDGDKPWSQDELKLLDEALSQVPQELLDRLPVRSIQRYAAAWDENWKIKPTTMGTYNWQTIPDRPGQLMIFDNALNPKYYEDTTGRTKFKATLIHELAHSLQETDSGSGTVKNPYASPAMVQFRDSTRSDPDPLYPLTPTGWVFNYDGTKRWEYRISTGFRNNLPPYRPGERDTPSAYSRTNQFEDMSVSVEMYMYDPQSLKAQSPKRYEYIKNNIFGGVEYDHGIRKP